MFYKARTILLLICLTVLFASFVGAQEKQSSDLFVVIVNGKVGFIDRTGKVKIKPQFNGANDFSEGLAVVGTFRSSKAGYINKTGKLVIPTKFDDAKDFSEGRAAVGFGEFGLHNSGEHKTGFINKTGKLVIKPKFRDAYSFSEGLAEVRDNGKSGYIDKTGKVVIPLKFDSASSFSEGLARVFFNGKYGFVDKTGKFVIEPQFSSACGFSEGLACVKIGGVVLEPYSLGIGVSGKENATYGYIDKTGKLVLKLDDVEGTNSFSEGLGRFYKKGNHGFIDKTGKIIIEPKYTTYSDFSEGLKSVYLNNGNGYGWIDKKGNLVIKTDFDSADDFHNGLAQVAEGKYPPDAKYGYIDKTGKVIWQPTK